MSDWTEITIIRNVSCPITRAPLKDDGHVFRLKWKFRDWQQMNDAGNGKIRRSISGDISVSADIYIFRFHSLCRGKISTDFIHNFQDLFTGNNLIASSPEAIPKYCRYLTWTH